MELKHDSQGFLVGERMGADEITDRLDAIREEVRLLRRDLSRPRAGAAPKAPAMSPSEASSAKPVNAPARSGRDSPVDKSPAGETVIKLVSPVTPAQPGPQEPGIHVYQSTETNTSNLVKQDAASGPAARNAPPEAKEGSAAIAPQRVRGAGGRFAPRSETTKPARDLSQPRAGGRRDSGGRFSAAPGQPGNSYDEGEEGALSRVFEGVGDRLTGAIQEVGSGAEEADPTVKAFNEVAKPLQRGFGKIMAGGEGRKQDRWYRRFWTMMRDSRRESRADGKRQQKLLKSIERKPTGGDGSALWRGLMLLIAPVMGVMSMLAGLPVMLAGALTAAIKVLLTALGLGRIARRIPVPGRRPPPRPGSRPAQAASPGGASRRPPPAGASPSAGGGRAGGLLRGGAKRIPIIGSLLGLGFMASDAARAESGDGTRAEKDLDTGRAIGGGLGGIGGMAGGAALGATIGSVVPVVGTVIGGIIGGVAGGFFGGSAGEVVGEKVGGWVTELRESDFVSGISERWEYTTTFMSSLWSQASEAVSSRWETVATAVGNAWSGVTESAKSLWDGVSSAIVGRWKSVTEAMKGAWDGAVSLAAKGWDALANMATGANAWIADKTGVDVAASVTAAADGVRDIAADVRENIKGAAYSAWDGVKSRASSAVEWAGNTAPGRAVRMAHNEASAMPALTSAMAEAGITDPNEQAAFLGQMHHESGGFRTMEESFNYRSADRIMGVSKTARNQGESAVNEAMAKGPEAVAELMYGGRMGNTEAGDGYLFRGRGFTQLTGRDNYTAAGEALGIDLVNNPDMAADPEVASRIATWYWQDRSGLSEAAQRGDAKEVTRLINGGQNGLADREEQTARFLGAAHAGDFSVKPAAVAGEAVDPGIGTEPAGAPSVPGAPELLGVPDTPLDTPASADPAYPDAQPALGQAAPAGVPPPPLLTINRSVAPTGAGVPATLAPVGSAVRAPTPISVPHAPAISDTPTVRAPLAVPDKQGDSKSRPMQADGEIGRDVPDRRIAHIVTGAYSGMG